MSAVRDIDPRYKWSRDYAKLFREMQVSSKICMVDYGPSMVDYAPRRDIAQTTKRNVYEIHCRGTCYIWVAEENESEAEADFIKQCIKYNVEWLDPDQECERCKGGR